MAKNGKPVSDYIKVQRSREIRLWVGQIATVVGAAVIYLESHPDAKTVVRSRINDVKARFKRKPKIKIVVVDDPQ